MRIFKTDIKEANFMVLVEVFIILKKQLIYVPGRENLNGDILNFIQHSFNYFFTYMCSNIG